jgi:hypothetical protein
MTRANIVCSLATSRTLPLRFQGVKVEPLAVTSGVVHFVHVNARVLLFATFASSAIGACRPPSAALDLSPRESRPLFAITVEDATEAALLQQQLQVTPVGLQGTTLFFSGDSALLERLRASGYDPAVADRLQVEHRVVRAYRRGEESALLNTGVHLLNREPGYWVIEGSLQQLQILQRLGYRLGPLGQNEPRPREVRITVPTRADVARVGELQVDIFGAQETKDGYVIGGAAFDTQIDALTRAGYRVERIPSVPRRSQ